MNNRPYELFIEGPEKLTMVQIKEGKYEGIKFSFINVRIENNEEDGNMYAHFEIVKHNKEFETEEEQKEFEEYVKEIFLQILDDAVKEIEEETKANDSNENNPTQSSQE